MQNDNSSEEFTTISTNVVVELPPDVSLSGETFKLKGLDSEQPILEISGIVYEGRYEEVVGTLLLFEKSEFDIKKGYKGRSGMRLIFKKKEEPGS